MRKIIIVILFMFLVSTAAFASVADIDTAYVSKYIWRGFDLNGAQPAIQPGASFALGNGGAALSLWGSYNMGSTTTREITELDATLSYDSSFGNGVDYSVGYTYYTFPNLTGAAAKSGEFYAGLTFSKSPVAPSITVFYDHDQGNGLYATLGGGYDFALEELGISTGLTVGYNAGQWAATPGISDITLSVSSAIEAGEVTISPSVNYVSIPGGTGVNSNSSETWFGLSVSGSI